MAAPRTRPFIGINADLVIPAKAAPFARIGVGYADAVTQSGGLPVVLPPYSKDLDLDELLDRLDGIVFTGGLDLDPRRAGQPTHPAVVPMPERREVADRRLIQAVIDRRMPIQKLRRTLPITLPSRPMKTATPAGRMRSIGALLLTAPHKSMQWMNASRPITSTPMRQ